MHSWCLPMTAFACTLCLVLGQLSPQYVDFRTQSVDYKMRITELLFQLLIFAPEQRRKPCVSLHKTFIIIGI